MVMKSIGEGPPKHPTAKNMAEDIVWHILEKYVMVRKQTKHQTALQLLRN